MILPDAKILELKDALLALLSKYPDHSAFITLNRTRSGRQSVVLTGYSYDGGYFYENKVLTSAAESDTF